MTLVLTTNIVGQPRGEPVRLPNRRRRLSTVVARHQPAPGRRFIVSVHRRGDQGEIYLPSDRTVRLRAAWPKTLVGPNDVVVITSVPLGKGVASIGLAIASIALIALAPYAAPLLAGSALFGGGAAVGGLTTAIQAGLVIGGVALGYAAQASKASGNKTGPQSYSITGGGNVPKPGSRRPLLYGKRWSSPPLSQQDYYNIDGDATVLVKRMTLGIGKFQPHRIRVGDALFWDETTGIQAPFSASTGPLGAAIEFLYEQPSTISPGDVIPSPSVGGQELPRPGGNPERTPWFRLAPQGVSVDAAQFNWTYPAIYRVSSKGERKGAPASVVFFGREIDPNTGTVIGPEFEAWRSAEPGEVLITTPLRRVAYFRLPKSGAYEISAQNAYPAPLPDVEIENRVVWDAMFAFEDDTRIRPQTTEIVMRMRAGKGLTVTAYSDITVEATRIVPVWDGTAWAEQPTRKAVWAYCDLVRAVYGLNAPNGVDADKALYYANLLAANDTYDGQLPEAPSFWEAASEILHPLRADPVKVGAVHSFVRDESRAEPRHVLTRRQIIRDSSGATFKTKVEGGDVIVEFDREGDPKRPDEARFSYGPPSRTPKRYKVAGIVDGMHALKHATWLAAVAVFRGAERKITTEWDGRLVYPGDHILSDLWFLKGKQAYGVASRNGNLLQLDVTANVPSDYAYGSIRTRAGREWGILRMRGVGPRGLELHPDDVIALAAQTGLQLSAVLARDTQDPTTVVLGDLVELQETYVARSAVPSDTDHVQIEMVADDARVWQLLDETVIAPFPVNADSLAEPLVPQISVLHARCVNIETGIEVVWGVSATRGARNYEADLSYDSVATWEVLSPFGPESSGRAPMRQVDGPVTVRARAYGRTGLPGDFIYTTFTTVAPIVDGTLIDPLSITIEKLSAQLGKDISDINAAGQGVLALGSDALSDGQGATQLALRTADDTLRGAIRQIEEAMSHLGDAQATQTTNSYLSRELIKVGNSANFAAIEILKELRLSDNEAFAGITTTLGARLTLAEGDIVGNSTAIQGLYTSVTNIDGVLTSQSQSITILDSRIDSNDLAISGQATATQQLTTRVTLTEGNISTLSEFLTALRSTVEDNTGKILGQATAQDTLRTRVDLTENAITAEAVRSTILEARVGTAEDQASGLSTSLDQTIVRTTAAEGNITTQAQRLGLLESTAMTQGGLISGNASALNQLTTRVSTNENNISTYAGLLTNLQAAVTTQGGDISGNAQATSLLSARADYVDGVLSTTATSIQALQTTQDGHSATLTTYGSSIDGVKVQFGVTGEIDGQTGGFIFTGIRKLDGSVSYSLNIKADVFVDGTITARKLSATELIVTSAQIGDLVVSTRSVGLRQITNMIPAVSGGTSVSAAVTVPANTQVIIKAIHLGAAAQDLPVTTIPGKFTIYRDTTTVIQVDTEAITAGTGSDRRVKILQTVSIGYDEPPAGTFTYRAESTNSPGLGGVIMIVETNFR